jgi:hypothetical protein
MSLPTLYQALLSTQRVPGEPVSEQMQQRIFEQSLAHQDWSTLTMLAKHEHLAPSVDARIRELDQLDVLHAWVTRKGRTSEELVGRILKDKRVNVLLPLAAIQGLDATVYQTIAKVKSPKLGEVLAANPSVPDAVRLSKIREFAQRAPRGAWQRHEDQLHKICGGSESGETSDIVRKLYETVAETSTITPWVLACLQRPYVRASDVDRWLDKLHAILDSGDGQWYSRNGDLIALLGRHAVTAPQRETLLANAKSYIANHGGRTWRVNYLNEAIQTLEKADNQFEHLLGEFVLAADSARCDELVAMLRTNGGPNDAPRIAEAVARHRHLPVATAMTFLSSMQTHGQANDLREFVLRLERENEYTCLATVVESYNLHGNHYVPGPVRWLDQPETFMRWYAGRVLNAGNLLPDWFSDSEMIANDPTLAIKAMRWVRLCQMIQAKAQLAKLVEQRILTVLGTDSARWEAFATLGQDFEGSLEDLLGAAASL